MKKLVVLFTLAFTVFTQAQDNDFRNWGTVNINQKIDEKFNFSSDIQYRTYEDLDQLNQLLLRGGVGYNLTENNNNLLLGYAFVHTRNPVLDDDYTTFNEHRIYQQFNTKHGINKVGLNHRFRFEERLMNDDIYFRFRYQLTATIPLNKPTLQKDAWFIKASNELFLNAIKQNNFDRNRLNVNVGYVLSPTFTIEAGYMKQHVQHQQTNHLQVGLTINNPITKKPS
ncbi:MAG: DUF2490 domain-containing protein [Weeksellaceae bacterium]|nr:DUF2490 domain-containing protein [Weeksellaceae bacterium]